MNKHTLHEFTITLSSLQVQAHRWCQTSSIGSNFRTSVVSAQEAVSTKSEESTINETNSWEIPKIRIHTMGNSKPWAVQRMPDCGGQLQKGLQKRMGSKSRKLTTAPMRGVDLPNIITAAASACDKDSQTPAWKKLLDSSADHFETPSNQAVSR